MPFDDNFLQTTGTSLLPPTSIDDPLVDLSGDRATLRHNVNGDSSSLNNVRPPQYADAYAKLQQFSTAYRESRPTSPKINQEQQRWLLNSGPVHSVVHDRMILDVFLGLFQSRLSTTFPCFRNFRIYRDTRQELYLAMAAVGGLYCDVPGSTKVAKWYYYNARRTFFTTVCRNSFLQSIFSATNR